MGCERVGVPSALVARGPLGSEDVRPVVLNGFGDRNYQGSFRSDYVDDINNNIITDTKSINI